MKAPTWADGDGGNIASGPAHGTARSAPARLKPDSGPAPAKATTTVPVMEPRGRWPGSPTAAPRIGWGISDAAIAFVLSLIAATIAETPFLSNGHLPKHLEVTATLVALLVQTAVAVGYLAIAARKGRGSLHADFGLTVHVRDGLWFIAGFLLAAAAGIAMAPIINAGHLSDSSQSVVRVFQSSQGIDRVLYALAVLIIAPIGEELLFRGALLRGLLRRTTPALAIWISGLVFALVHVALDPGAGFAVPALLALGLLSGYRAWKTGDLSQSILLHAGFNLLAVLQILT
jgi:membrane protease YdiL (CAAX protease family)